MNDRTRTVVTLLSTKNEDVGEKVRLDVRKLGVCVFIRYPTHPNHHYQPSMLYTLRNSSLNDTNVLYIRYLIFLVFHIRCLIYCLIHCLIRYSNNNTTDNNTTNTQRFSVINTTVHNVNSNVSSSVSSSLYVRVTVVITTVVVLAFFILE